MVAAAAPMETDSSFAIALSDSSFRCSHCDMTFSKKDHLTRHIRAHTNQRPYACNICSKRFSRSDVLRRHTQLHSNIKGGAPTKDHQQTQHQHNNSTNHNRSSSNASNGNRTKRRNTKQDKDKENTNKDNKDITNKGTKSNNNNNNHHNNHHPYPSPPTNDSPPSVATPSAPSAPEDSPASVPKDEPDVIGVDFLRAFSQGGAGGTLGIDPQHLSRPSNTIHNPHAATTAPSMNIRSSTSSSSSTSSTDHLHHPPSITTTTSASFNFNPSSLLNDSSHSHHHHNHQHASPAPHSQNSPLTPSSASSTLPTSTSSAVAYALGNHHSQQNQHSHALDLSIGSLPSTSPSIAPQLLTPVDSNNTPFSNTSNSSNTTNNNNSNNNNHLSTNNIHLHNISNTSTTNNNNNNNNNNNIHNHHTDNPLLPSAMDLDPHSQLHNNHTNTQHQNQFSHQQHNQYQQQNHLQQQQQQQQQQNQLANHHNTSTSPMITNTSSSDSSSSGNSASVSTPSEPFSSVSLNPFLTDSLDGANNNNVTSGGMPFQPNTSPWAAPLLSQQQKPINSLSAPSDLPNSLFWQSSLLDFSSLFSSSATHFGSASRPHSPVSFSRLSQEERVKTMWPTRPFRKQEVSSSQQQASDPHNRTKSLSALTAIDDSALDTSSPPANAQNLFDNHPNIKITRSQSLPYSSTGERINFGSLAAAMDSAAGLIASPPTTIDFSSTVIRPEIDAATTSRMTEVLKSGSISFDYPIPSQALFNKMLTLYFVHCHPMWPFLHPPTFQPSKTSPLVLLNMVALGGLYCNSPELDSGVPVAISRKMHEILTFSMSPALHYALEETEKDALQLCQACMLRQLFGLLGGNRESLESAQIFHSSVVNVARRAGLFAPDPDQPAFESDETMDLETKWRTWASREVRKRTAFCFVLNDMSFAALFLTPPHTAAGALMWPLPDPDIQFEAQNPMAWKTARSATPQSTTPFYDLAPALFLSRRVSAFACATHTSVGRNTLLTSIVAVVLATRANRPTLESDLLKDPSACAPLAGALMSALNSLPSPTDMDTFSSGVLWELAWVHLLTDVKIAELASGREGNEAAQAATDTLRRWSCTPRARRAILHCVMVTRRINQMIISNQEEVAPHVYIALFQAWMVLRTYMKLTDDPSSTWVPKGWIDWMSIASAGLSHQPMRSSMMNHSQFNNNNCSNNNSNNNSNNSSASPASATPDNASSASGNVNNNNNNNNHHHPNNGHLQNGTSNNNTPTPNGFNAGSPSLSILNGGNNNNCKPDDQQLPHLKDAAARFIWTGESVSPEKGEQLSRLCSSIASTFASLGKAPLKDMFGNLLSDVEMSDLVKSEST